MCILIIRPKNKNIFIIKNNANLGIAKALNQGFKKCNKTKNLDLAIKEQQISRDAVWYGFKHKEDAIKKMQKTNCDKQLKHTCMYKH